MLFQTIISLIDKLFKTSITIRISIILWTVFPLSLISMLSNFLGGLWLAGTLDVFIGKSKSDY